MAAGYRLLAGPARGRGGGREPRGGGGRGRAGGGRVRAARTRDRPRPRRSPKEVRRSIHSLGDNLAFAHRIEVGDVDAAFGSAAAVAEQDFGFGRHTAVTLEPRVIIADYQPADGTLVVHQSHQSPYQMQEVYAALLGIDDHRVRVICPDVGGGFGLKINVHDDEIATAAIARLLGRPVKFCADRLEAFGADAHSRDHTVRGRIAVSERRRDPRHGGRRPVCDRGRIPPSSLRHRRGHDDDHQCRRALPRAGLSRRDAGGLCQQADRRHVSRRRRADRLAR